MATIDERIARLEEMLRQARARKQRIEARKRATEARIKRAQDTRRKILVGAVVLAMVDRGEWPRDQLLAILNAALARSDDRALFGLPPLPDQGGEG